MSVVYQALGTFIVCWVRMGNSMSFFWPSFTVDLFKSDATPLHRPMSDMEASVFGSIQPIGATIATPVLGLLLDVLGRKKCVILAAIVHVLAWTIIVFSRRVEVLLTGMFIAGMATSVLIVIPIYIAEICQASVRGAMASGMILSSCFGNLLAYLIGGLMDYTSMCYLYTSVIVLGLLMALTLKESPVFLMKKGRQQEAVQTIAFYRNTKSNSKTVFQEIDAIRKILNSVKEVTKEEETLTGSIDKPEQEVSCWQFFKTSKSTRKAAIVALVLMLCTSFQGYVTVVVYAGPMFKGVAPGLSPLLCSLLLAIIGIFASLLSTYLIDVAGRRPLLMYSSLGSGLCCVLLGSQIQLQWGPHVLSAVVIFLFSFIYTLGSGLVPFVLAAELFLPKVSSVMSMVVYEVTWLSTFAVLFAFGPLASALGLGGLFYVFAATCLLTTVYAAYFLPETKGLAVDAIQKLFL